MKQRNMFLLGILSMALIFVLVSTACSNDTGTKTYTVSFDVGDGGGSAPADQKVDDGKSISLPGQGSMTAPTGKEFDGWRGDGQNLAAGASYTVTKDVTFTAQWKDPGSGTGGNVIEGGITVLATSSGIRITLDQLKIPSGTAGIQYYIRGPNYTKPVQIWFSLDEVPTVLNYPFTEAGSSYSVETQYTRTSGGNEPTAATVTITATGGSGDIMLRNSPSVTYRSSNQSIEITPAPDFRKPGGWACTYGLVLYLADENRAVYITHFNENTADTTELSLNQFKTGQSYDSGRPLSQYDNQNVFIEAGYYFEASAGVHFKIVIGNSSTFKFPYIN